MIRHIILYKFHDSVSQQRREDTINTLRALGQNIPEVREWSIGRQAFPSSTAYDVAQISGFENLEALERYRSNPEHMRVKNLMSEITDRVVVDYEY